MFEDQLAAVHELLVTDKQFKSLYDEHSTLKNEIDSNGRVMDAATLDRLKKKKLLLKDQMATRLSEHTNATT